MAAEVDSEELLARPWLPLWGGDTAPRLVLCVFCFSLAVF